MANLEANKITYAQIRQFIGSDSDDSVLTFSVIFLGFFIPVGEVFLSLFSQFFLLLFALPDPFQSVVYIFICIAQSCTFQ